MKHSNRRGFLSALAAVSGLLPASLCLAGEKKADSNKTETIDFSRSFMHYVPRTEPIWVRIQLECCCDIVDRASGRRDRYLLGVRTQTGLRTMPPSDVLDPGYDFWMIFSDKNTYIRRTHTSAGSNNPSVLPHGTFVERGWHLQPAAARRLRNGQEIREALRGWKRVVARTELESDDGSRSCVIQYPVKWADGNDNGTFRVETGPVLLLDANRNEVGEPAEFDDFRWAYLDYRSFDKARIFLERPTSILSGTAHKGVNRKSAPALTPAQIEQIEQRLYSGWEMPVAEDAMREIFKTDHFSEVARRGVKTSLFALD